MKQEQLLQEYKKLKSYSAVAKKYNINRGVAYRIVNAPAGYTEKKGNKTRYSKKKYNDSLFNNEEAIVFLYSELKRWIQYRYRGVGRLENNIYLLEVYDKLLDYAYSKNWESIRELKNKMRYMVKYPHVKKNNKFEEEI